MLPKGIACVALTFKLDNCLLDTTCEEQAK